MTSETAETAQTRAPSTRRAQDVALRTLSSVAERARRLTLDERIALGLGVIALVLRLWPLGTFSSEFDEGVYWQSLRALLAGHPLFSSVFCSQPPAFLVSILPFYALFGQSLGAARLGIAAYSMLGPIAFYVLGRALRGRWTGILAGAFLAFDPLYLTESHTLQAEAPALGWMALAVALAALVPRARDVWQARWLAFGAGAVLALGTLTKLFDVVGVVPVLCYLALPLWSAALDAGRLRLLPSALLRERVLEVRPVVLAALSGGLALTFVALLPFVGSLGALWHQVVAYHLAAAGALDVGLRHNLRFLVTTLLGGLALPLAVLAVLLLAIAGRVRDWSLLPAVLWALASFMLLARQQPLFSHDIVLMVAPLALLAALALNLAWSAVTEEETIPTGEGIGEGVGAGAGAHAPHLFPANLARVPLQDLPAALGVFRSALLVLACGGLALGMALSTRDDAAAASYVPAAELQMAIALDAVTPSQDIVVTDDPYAAALADRAVPPQLVDTSSVRIRSGYLTARDLEQLITRTDSRTILFGSGRFTQVEGFQPWVAARFQVAARLGDGRVLYVKVPMQDQHV